MSNSPKINSEVERVFNRIDENGDGKISASELGKVVRSLGTQVTNQELDVMIQEMDSDQDGYVDINEFAEFHKEEGDGTDLKDAFGMYDLNGNELISASELHMVMTKLGEGCSFEDCVKMIESVDTDGDGCVNFEEFKNMMIGSTTKKD